MGSVDGQPAAATDQSFSRDHHILKRRVFLHTYEQGQRAHGRLVAIFCLKREEEGPWRVGLTVSKKTAANSVDRNRLRRRVREFFRRRSVPLPEGWDFVINLKGAAKRASSAELNADLTQTLKRLGFAAETPSSPGHPTEQS